MTEQNLLDIVYKYYPKEIFPTEDAFLRTNQFFLLRKLMEKGNDDKSAISKFILRLRKEFPIWDIMDLVSELNYPCYTIQCIFEKTPNKVRSFTVYISLLLPVHSVYLLEMSKDRYWNTKEIVPNEWDGREMSRISRLTSECLNTYEIEPELLQNRIEGILITENFTVFNALYTLNHKMI